MTAQVMPLNMADMSDEKLTDFFFAKAFTDDEPEGEPPTIPKERWRLTNAVTTSKRTPLHLAAERGEVDSLWLLSDYGADLNAQDTKGRTPLHRATYEGQVDSAEVLIVLGASTRIQGKSGKNPLEVARLSCKYLRS